MNVRTRFAPSPTGFLHIGGLRTALYAYFFARQNGGTMILRVEDTDKEREVEGAVPALVHVLHHMGIDYNEGPKLARDHESIEEVGKYGPYTQSKRLALYREHVDQLIAGGHAYHCFCTPERLKEMREAQTAAKHQPKYDRHCLTLSPEQIQKHLANHTPHVVRMKIPEGETVVEDVVYGRMVFPNADLDDQVLLKSDGYPTYHLAVVVDDHLMEISHVLRGEDWLPSTPKHAILYQMFGWTPPVFAHLPNLLNANRKKLSKRKDDVAVEGFLEKGYLPEALNNFVATLGFNPKADQEIYTMDELIKLFDLTKVNRGGAIVNYEKLDWMNGQYIRKMDPARLAKVLHVLTTSQGVQTGDGALFERIVTVERERMTTFKDILEVLPMYQQTLNYVPELLIWKKADREDAKRQLAGIQSLLSTFSEETFGSVSSLESAVKEYIAKEQLPTGNVLWPLRVALSGQAESPGPFELLWVFGKIEALKRLKHAEETLT